MCLMAAFVPHRSNKYFHVTASNGIVSNSPLYIMTASPIASVYSNCAPNAVGARSRDHRAERASLWRYASGPSSSGNSLPSSIRGHAARRSALPRERFSPLAQSGRSSTQPRANLPRRSEPAAPSPAPCFGGPLTSTQRSISSSSRRDRCAIEEAFRGACPL